MSALHVREFIPKSRSMWPWKTVTALPEPSSTRVSVSGGGVGQKRHTVAASSLLAKRISVRSPAPAAPVLSTARCSDQDWPMCVSPPAIVPKQPAK